MNKRNSVFKFVFLSGWLIFMPMQALDMKSIFSEVMNNYKIGFASLSSVATDKYQFRILGWQDLSPETQKKIDKILAELGLSGKVHVKQMSDFAIEEIGAHNALATANAIYINEETFNTLSNDEQRFLIGHEAGHVKNKDVVRGAASTFIGAGVVLETMQRFSNRFVRGIAFPAGMIGSALMGSAYQRFAEKEADRHALEKLNCHDGVISWNAKYTITDKVRDDALLSRIKVFVDWLFSTHPSQEERIEYAVQAKNNSQVKIRLI